MSLNDLANGSKILVLDVILRTATTEERRSLVNYLFYSNYLDDKKSIEELNYISILFNYFKDEYFTKFKKSEFSSQKEDNFRIIFKNFLGN